jgi:hypothetical protein
MKAKPPAVIARSASDEAIHFSVCGAMDCFAALAMTETAIDRHPEVAASSAALEGRRPGSVILRGSQGLAPQDDDPDARVRTWLETFARAA